MSSPELQDGLSLEEAASLISRCTPMLGAAPIRRFSQAWDNHVFELAGRFVAKISRGGEEGGAKLSKEACLLPYLRARLGPIVPEEEASCVVRLGGALRVVLVYRKIVGATYLEAGLGSGGHALCETLAATLQRIHALDVPDTCAEKVPFYGEPKLWAKRMLEEVERLAAMAGPTLEPDLKQRALRRVGEYAEWLSRAGLTPKFIHGDVDPRNIIVGQDGALCGLIDWGEACIGDPALDYAGLYFNQHLGQHVLEAQSEEPPQSMQPRIEFHLDIAPLYYVAYGAKMGNRALVEDGLRQLKARLAP